MHLNLRKTKQSGHSHLIVPVVAMVVVAGIGSYVLTQSHADSLPCVRKVVSAHKGYDKCVDHIQLMLNTADDHKASNTIGRDGKFGPQTLGRVKGYQTNHNLSSDGIVGPKTWHSLCTHSTKTTSAWKDAGCASILGPNER